METAFIAMAFYRHFGPRKILENVLQRRGMLLQGRASIGPQVVPIEIESMSAVAGLTFWNFYFRRCTLAR